MRPGFRSSATHLVRNHRLRAAFAAEFALKPTAHRRQHSPSFVWLGAHPIIGIESPSLCLVATMRIQARRHFLSPIHPAFSGVSRTHRPHPSPEVSRIAPKHCRLASWALDQYRLYFRPGQYLGPSAGVIEAPSALLLISFNGPSHFEPELDLNLCSDFTLAFQYRVRSTTAPIRAIDFDSDLSLT
ncbi:hypothetical protein B0H15DRAFT_854780 [Mycena belliarum]|uniref:Uncharacterized protein n=1 Tax=Mycena belliarum TaxID=1033014 RepID=A0AAD6TXY2_9AGAR|nr:hypothetical protein B0H15DRAFT_854780 [Mycena belliae]